MLPIIKKDYLWLKKQCNVKNFENCKNFVQFIKNDFTGKVLFFVNSVNLKIEKIHKNRVLPIQSVF